MSAPAPPSAARRSHPATSLLCGIAGLALWIVAIRQADFSHIGAYGLVTIVGWPYFIGLALVVAGLVIELLQPLVRPAALFFLVVLLIVVLFGTASAVEPIARLTDSWVIAGFVQYVYAHGHPLDNFDARFSWPGGLSLGSVIVGFTGQPSAVALLRWAPLAFEFFYLPPLLAIAKFSGVGSRAGWLGIMIFYSANWIDQDYFSPQALNILFFLVVIATVLACWRPADQTGAGHRVTTRTDRLGSLQMAFSRRRIGGRDAVATRDIPRTLAVMALLLLLCLASAISHQLTPYALVIELAACVFARRLGRPELVVIAALVAIGWLSLGASNYWFGHLSAIFGQIGHFGSTFGTNLSGRITGSVSHRLIVDFRILLVAALFALAGLGALRRAAETRVLELLAAGPFLLLALQDYGGEGLLRVVLYGLPFTSLLAGSAVFPTRDGPIRAILPDRSTRAMARRRPGLMAMIVVLFFGVGTTVVRGGNDAYEAYTVGELSAVNFTYDHVHEGETIGAVTSYLPIDQRDYGTVPFLTASSRVSRLTPATLRTVLLENRPSWIILSQSQEAWGQILCGFPKGWETALKNALLQQHYEVAAKWSTATVLKNVTGT